MAIVKDMNFYGVNWVDGPTANRDLYRQAFIDWNPRSFIVNSLDSARFWRNALPNAVIGLRNMSGFGADNSVLLRLNPREWWSKWEPLIPELRRLHVHAVLGNEPNGYGSDFVTVVERSLEIGHMLNDAGVRGMYCRFSVGNPTHEPRYLEQLIPLFDFIRRSGGYYMVNEYLWYNRPPLEQRDFVGRFQQAWDVAGEVPTIIGEISVNTAHPLDENVQDSASGFRVSGLNGAQFADVLELVADEIYIPAGVHSGNIFIAGGFEDQRIQDILGEAELFNAMQNYRPFVGVEMPPPSVPTPPPPPLPSFNVTLIPNGNYNVRIRMSASLDADIIGAVTPGGLRAYDDGLMSGDFGIFTFEDTVGFVHMDFITIIRDNPNNIPSIPNPPLIPETLQEVLIDVAVDMSSLHLSLHEALFQLNSLLENDPPPPPSN